MYAIGNHYVLLIPPFFFVAREDWKLALLRLRRYLDTVPTSGLWVRGLAPRRCVSGCAAGGFVAFRGTVYATTCDQLCCGQSGHR